jgi:hydroxymethylbilane synthase
MLIIASRGSQLALWQAHWVQQQLAALGYPSRIEIVKTTGDKITDVPLAQVGGKGLFTKEIEEALLEGRADLAVHSLKDLPTELPAGLVLAATPAREDPRDALVGRRLADLPAGAKLGTSSLRRAAQLRKVRPDLRIEPVRGNLDTRLRKLDEGQYDAIVLAAAGLKRLGWEDRIAEILSPDIVCPAVGQGALAIETGQSGLLACQKLNHAAHPMGRHRRARSPSRSGRRLPGPHRRLRHREPATESLAPGRGGLADGVQLVRDRSEGPAADAQRIGRELGEALLAAGADSILESVYG